MCDASLKSGQWYADRIVRSEMRASTVLVIVGAFLTARMIADSQLFAERVIAGDGVGHLCDGPLSQLVVIPHIRRAAFRRIRPDLDCNDIPYAVSRPWATIRMGSMRITMG